MHENMIMYIAYFFFMLLGLGLSAWPFFSRRKWRFPVRIFFFLLISGHLLLLFILLLSYREEASRDPPGNLGQALIWIYGLIGHACLAGMAALVRVVAFLLGLKGK